MSEALPPQGGGSRSVAASGQGNLISGGVLVLLALTALAVSFYHPGPAGFWGPIMWPRVFAVLTILAGLGMATGQIHIRNKQDFYGGLALIGLAVVAQLASIDLPGMRGFAFGPGTAPRLFANLLAVLGLALSVTALLTDGPEGQRYTLPGIVVIGAAIGGWALVTYVLSQIMPQSGIVIATAGLIVISIWKTELLDSVGVRGPYLITLSIFVFAIFIRPLGLVAASMAAVLTCAGAAPDIRWRETILWAEVLTAFCSVLFPYGLNLPFQLWPNWWQQEFFIRPLWVAIAIVAITVVEFARSHVAENRGAANV